jgi:hypothetical protein
VRGTRICFQTWIEAVDVALSKQPRSAQKVWSTNLRIVLWILTTDGGEPASCLERHKQRELVPSVGTAWNAVFVCWPENSQYSVDKPLKPFEYTPVSSISLVFESPSLFISYVIVSSLYI